MTRTGAAATTVLSEFDPAWRDDVPVFACCRKSVATAVEKLDLVEISSLDVTERVQAIRGVVEAEQPGHLAAHRCCAGHLANVAFDLPELIAPEVEAGA
ncbi:MAG: hypothetical protein GEU81_04480 [Nitriliruptorales bacterium]|nr:hypothetical protein [Nitriliruptorales bacterium]